jgi:hypothetical protein
LFVIVISLEEELKCVLSCLSSEINRFLHESLLKTTCFVFKLKRKKQVLALVLIEDLGFLPLVREIQRLPLVPLRSTREKTEFLTLVNEIPEITTL